VASRNNTLCLLGSVSHRRIEQSSESEAEAPDDRPRLQEMGSAERGEKVVERHLVRQLGDRQRRCDPLVRFGVQQVVRSHAEVDQVREKTRSGL
jgi:hypothetical protein